MYDKWIQMGCKNHQGMSWSLLSGYTLTLLYVVFSILFGGAPGGACQILSCPYPIIAASQFSRAWHDPSIFWWFSNSGTFPHEPADLGMFGEAPDMFFHSRIMFKWLKSKCCWLSCPSCFPFMFHVLPTFSQSCPSFSTIFPGFPCKQLPGSLHFPTGLRGGHLRWRSTWSSKAPRSRRRWSPGPY